MRDNVLFACAALHPKLTGKASSLIDREVTCFWDAEPINFLLSLLFNVKEKYDWVVKFDEDAFIFDLPRLYKLMDYMKSEKIDVAGVADGGVIEMRNNNPIAMSPSFNILNIKNIRKTDLKTFDTNPSCDDLIRYTPTSLLKYPYKYNNSEIYYPLYFGLLRAGYKFLYLDGETYKGDEISTYVHDHQKAPFLIHTWFARTYDPKLEGIKPYPLKPPKLAVSMEYNAYRINDVFEKHKTLELAKREYNKQIKK